MRKYVFDKFKRMVLQHTDSYESWDDGVIECVLNYYNLHILREDLTPTERHIHNLNTLQNFVMNVATVKQLYFIEQIADENPMCLNAVGFCA